MNDPCYDEIPIDKQQSALPLGVLQLLSHYALAATRVVRHADPNHHMKKRVRNSRMLSNKRSAVVPATHLTLHASPQLTHHPKALQVSRSCHNHTQRRYRSGEAHLQHRPLRPAGGYVKVPRSSAACRAFSETFEVPEDEGGSGKTERKTREGRMGLGWHIRSATRATRFASAYSEELVCLATTEEGRRG